MSNTTLKVSDPIALRQLADDLGLLGADGLIPLRNGLPFFSERVRGARVHHNMGAGANLGELRLGAGGQIEAYEGSGAGGESYAWHAFDPNRADQSERAASFQRYGPNWSSGGIPMAPFSGHATDIRAQLEEMLGRKATFFEWYDRVYGVAGAPAGQTVPPPSRDYAALLREVLAKVEAATKQPRGEVGGAGGGRIAVLLRNLIGELDKIRTEAAARLA
jgi:hypothetical protein